MRSLSFFVRRACCAAILFAPSGWKLAAAEAARDIGRQSPYLIRGWNTDNGLPDNVVSQVAQDRTGFLWLATNAGLVRFDSQEFKRVPLPSGPPGSEQVRAFAFAPDGAILFLPATGGLFMLKNNVVTVHPLTAQLPKTELLEIFVEPDGTIWLGATGEFMRCKDDIVQHFGSEQGIWRGRPPVSWAVDDHRRPWIALSDLLACYEGSELTKVRTTRRVNFRVAPSRHGGPWVLADELCRWQNGEIVRVAELPWPRGRTAVQSMYEDSDGNLWLGTAREGAFFFDGTKFHAVSIGEPMVTCITQDREGNIWMGTNGGLKRLRPQRFTWIDYPATSIAEDSTGTLWFASGPDGLVRRTDASLQAIALSGSRDTMQVRAVAIEPGDARTWIAARTGLYVTPTHEPGPCVRISEPRFDAFDVRSVYPGAGDKVWIGGVGVFGYFHADTYASLVEQLPPHTNVTTLLEATSRALWLGTSQGELYRCDGDRIVGSGQRITGGAINGLLSDGHDGLWAATNRGLAHVNNGKVRVLTEEQGLPSNIVRQALRSNAGDLWITTPRGLFRIAADELAEVAQGARLRISSVAYGPDDGVANLSPHSDLQPSAWKDRTGKLWFCTYNGVLGFDPAVVGAAATDVPVRIDEIRLNGQPQPTAEQVTVPAGDQHIEFRCVALGFAAPERVRLLHRLEGMDSGWVETPSDRRIRYGRLPPRDYRLRVVACNTDGSWTSAEASVAVAVLPWWWQTWWFRAVAGLIGATAVGLTARYLSHRSLTRRLEKLEREHAIEKERARIARDMHDDLGGTITSINLAVQRLKTADAAESASIVGVVDRRVRQLSLELDRVVWTVSPKNSSWDALAAFIARFAQEFFATSPVRCRTAGADRIPAMPVTPECQHHVLAMAKEIFNNVLKHAAATEIAIELSLQGGVFTLTIRDNGVGFELADTNRRHGNGLSNIETRVAEIGGTLTLKTSRGAGTIFVLKIPAASARRR